MTDASTAGTIKNKVNDIYEQGLTKVTEISPFFYQVSGNMEEKQLLQQAIAIRTYTAGG